MRGHRVRAASRTNVWRNAKTIALFPRSLDLARNVIGENRNNLRGDRCAPQNRSVPGPQQLPSFMFPPADLPERVARFHRYSVSECQRSLESIRENPTGLKLSLRCWLQAAVYPGRSSAGAINSPLFCERGMKVGEFISLHQAPSFSEVVKMAAQWEPPGAPKRRPTWRCRGSN